MLRGRGGWTASFQRSQSIFGRGSPEEDTLTLATTTNGFRGLCSWVQMVPLEGGRWPEIGRQNLERPGFFLVTLVSEEICAGGNTFRKQLRADNAPYCTY